MDVSKHVERAEEALQKKNFGYAVSLAEQVLSLKADHRQAYQVLCRASRQGHERKPRPVWLARVVGVPHLLSSGLCKLTRNSAGRARALTKYLKLEPGSSSVYLALGESLCAANSWNGAVGVYESLAEAEPKNGDAWRLAAACHARLQEVDAALECLERALAANPRDAEAERMRKNLAADATLRAGAYDKAATSRDLMKDAREARRLERDQRIHRTDQELGEEQEELRQALVGNPRDGRARRRLAEILAAEDPEGAIALLEEGRDHDDNVADLEDRMGDYRIATLDREVQKLQQRLKKEPSENLREDLALLRKDRAALQAQEYRRRTAARPTDLALWFSLGKALEELGDVEEAIGAFQRSVKDPKTRVDSLTRLGGLFHAKGLHDLAEKQLSAALEETSPTSEKGKSILYNLGLVAEKAGRSQDAFQYFTKVYEVDIQYRDVASKIELLRP